MFYIVYTSGLSGEVRGTVLTGKGLKACKDIFRSSNHGYGSVMYLWAGIEGCTLNEQRYH